MFLLQWCCLSLGLGCLFWTVWLVSIVIASLCVGLAAAAATSWSCLHNRSLIRTTTLLALTTGHFFEVLNSLEHREDINRVHFAQIVNFQSLCHLFGYVSLRGLFGSRGLSCAWRRLSVQVARWGLALKWGGCWSRLGWEGGLGGWAVVLVCNACLSCLDSRARSLALLLKQLTLRACVCYHGVTWASTL